MDIPPIPPVVSPAIQGARPVTPAPVQRAESAYAQTAKVGQTGAPAPRVASKEEAPDSGKQDEKGLTKEGLTEAADSANQAMAALQTDVQFQLHEKTGTMMVKVVSAKDGTVLREYPPKEFLDMIAKLKDMVGAFIDEKA